jgi:hypothetical protein
VQSRLQTQPSRSGLGWQRDITKDIEHGNSTSNQCTLT